MNLTELEAINLMRGAIGKAPVSSLDAVNPDVIAARARLRNTAIEVQATSWWFNTERTVTLVPNTEGEVVIPSNALEVRTHDPFAYLTIRGKRLYDPTCNTFQLDRSINVDMIVFLEYDQLPYVASNYIQYEAARKFQADYDGDPVRVQQLRQDAQLAKIELKTAEQRNRRTNMLLGAGPVRLNSGIRPYSTFGGGRNANFPGG